MSNRELKGSRPPKEVEDINRRTWESDHTFIISTPAKTSKMSKDGEFQKIVGKHREWKKGMTEQELIDYCYQPFIDLCKALDAARKEFPIVTAEMMSRATPAQLEVYLLTYQNVILKLFGGESK